MSLPIEQAPCIARYRLGRRIGVGGLGVVYAGHDLDLDRAVALKLIRLGSHGKGAFERLRQEAQALARVTHPHVIDVFDVGQYDLRGVAGWPPDVPRVGAYIVMELVEGMDLKQWLETRRSEVEVLSVFVGAGRGLAAAHAAGLVHRDFKPANVIVDAEGRAKVLDFGLAQLRAMAGPSTGGPPSSDDAGAADSMTRTGTVMGTPAYMAPEQHLGDRADVRSDQYAYCVSLAEALCGARPFGSNEVSELNRAKLAREYDPCFREMPKSLRPVVERGLDPDPEARWPSMADLLSALSRGRAGRARWWVGGLGLALAGVVGWQLATPDAAVTVEPTPAPAPVGVPADGVAPSPGAAAFRRQVEQTWPERFGDGVRDALDALPAEPDPDEDPSFAAELLLWRGYLRDDQQAVDFYRRAFFLAREADIPSVAARAAISMATAYVEDHGQSLAEWTRHAWVELYRGPWDRRAAVQVMVSSGYGRAVIYEDEDTLAMLELADAAIGETQPDDDAFMAYQMLELASALRYVNASRRSLYWARRASTLLDGVASPEHPLRALAEDAIGVAIADLGRCDEASPYLARARQGYRREGEPETVDSALTGISLADCLAKQGRTMAAIDEYRTSITFWSGLGPDYGMRQIDAHIEIARLLKTMARLEDAEVEYERALAVANPAGPEPYLRTVARRELAALRAGEG
ncbi:MAG: serine/threonine-protein kinase [Myxococcota bacterium]